MALTPLQRKVIIREANKRFDQGLRKPPHPDNDLASRFPRPKAEPAKPPVKK